MANHSIFLLISVILYLSLMLFIFFKNKKNLVYYFITLLFPLIVGFSERGFLINVTGELVGASAREYWWALLLFFMIVIALINQFFLNKIYVREAKILRAEQKQYQKYLLSASKEILLKRDFFELQTFIIQTLVGTAVVTPDDFRHLDVDVEKLWLSLKKEKYISEHGRILEKFRMLKVKKDMQVDESFRNVRDAVFEILKCSSEENGFPISHARFFLYNKELREYELIKFRGKERRKQVQDRLDIEHPVIFMSDLRKDIFSRDDVESDGALDNKIKQKILGKMRSLGARLFVPIYIDNDPCGFIVVGSKLKGGEYSEADIIVLKIFANNIASAIGNIWAYEHREKTYLQTIYSFTNFIDAKDNYTRQHSENVKNYIDRFMDKCKGKIAGEDINLDKDLMQTAALLHDIGKIAISDHTLKSHRTFGNMPKGHIPDSLRRKIKIRDDQMFKELEMHTVQGANMISSIEVFRDIKNAILCHHEKWDGTGYPNKLKGKEIPLEARVLSVIDTYDAITTTRLYDSAKSVEHALAILRLNKNIQFQPEIVDIFEEVIKEIHNVNDTDIEKIMVNEKHREDERRKRRSKYV